jgi:hypothetical protein
VSPAGRHKRGVVAAIAGKRVDKLAKWRIPNIMGKNVEKVAKSGEKWGRMWITLENRVEIRHKSRV